MLVFFSNLAKSYGISGQIFDLSSSVLSNRQLHVVLDEKSSQEYPVNAGVSQGSILGHDFPDDASDLSQQLDLASELESDLKKHRGLGH